MILLSRISVLGWRIIGAVIVAIVITIVAPVMFTSHPASTQAVTPASAPQPSGLIRVCSETPGQIRYQSIAENGTASPTQVWNIAIGSELFVGTIQDNTYYWQKPGSTHFVQLGLTGGTLCLLG